MSAAAGAVGSLAAQFAKLRGHRVIGSAGSDDEGRLPARRARARRGVQPPRGPVAELLRAAAPDGIDVYFDYVGGDHLEAALGALRRGGRVALCGAVSEYERRAGAGPAQPVPGDRERPDAARVPRQQQPAPDGRHGARRQRLARRGRLRYHETVVDGLEHAPEALARVLAGDTIGKTLVRIA